MYDAVLAGQLKPAYLVFQYAVWESTQSSTACASCVSVTDATGFMMLCITPCLRVRR